MAEDRKPARLELFLSQGPPCHDLALERWLLERAATGQPCLALYSWERAVVVLGYAQPETDVDLDWCRDAGIPVVRRLTGGTGVIHRRDLAVSLALPKTHPWARSIASTYTGFLHALTPALRSAGSAVERTGVERHASRVRSPICFEDQLSDTLAVSGRKAVGCAQARRAHAVLVHAAVLLNLDVELYASVFRVPAERVERALAPALPGGRWQAVGMSVATALATALGLEPQPQPIPTLPEQLLELYQQPRWAPVP